MRRTRARGFRPFRFACRNILNGRLSDWEIKATRARANLLQTRRESRERLARAHIFSRPFNKIDGRPPCELFNLRMRSINYCNVGELVISTI